MIESIITEEQKQEEEKYPCLMKGPDGRIVLFHEDRSGVMLLGRESESTKIGIPYDDWSMENFKPFKGELTLKNK